MGAAFCAQSLLNDLLEPLSTAHILTHEETCPDTRQTIQVLMDKMNKQKLEQLEKGPTVVWRKLSSLMGVSTHLEASTLKILLIEQKQQKIAAHAKDIHRMKKGQNIFHHILQ